MPRGNIEITQTPHRLFLDEVDRPIVQKCKKCKGYQREKYIHGNEKKGRIFFVGQDTFRVSRKALSAPDGRFMSL